MKYYLLSIGCDDYYSDTLSNLSGASNDASNIYNCLVNSEYSIYDKNSSKLLTSPSVSSVISTLESVLLDNEPPDIFTLFFAGHGGVATGTYYLCLSDTRTDRIGFSALSLSEVFRKISSSGVRHVNLIIDACNTGGLVHDLTSIIKPDLMGAKGSFGIAILAAAASDEYAGEVAGQGLLTSNLLNYINGRKRLNTSTEYLDLVSIGRQLSTEFIESSSAQTPSSWGINLYGPSLFSKNPFYNPDDAIGAYEFSYIPPASRLGVIIQESKREFLGVLDNIEDTDSLQKLLTLFQRTLKDTDDVDDVLALVSGIGYRFIEQVGDSASFLKLDLINVLLTCLLPYCGDSKVDLLVNKLIRMFSHYGTKCLEELNRELDKDKYFLVQKEGHGFDALSNYYYLPIRITKILGLLSQLVVIDHKQLVNVLNAIQAIHKSYVNHFMCMCDIQAPFLYVLFKVFSGSDIEKVKPILISYLMDFLKTRGQVSKLDITPESALTFTLQRYTQEKIDGENKASPGQIGAALLMAASDFRIEKELDDKLILLDRVSLHLFIPHTIKEFSDPLIERGQNLVVRCGFDFWNVQEFASICKKHIEEYTENNFAAISDIELICCIASAFVQPDRLPVMLK